MINTIFITIFFLFRHAISTDQQSDKKSVENLSNPYSIDSEKSKIVYSYKGNGKKKFAAINLEEPAKKLKLSVQEPKIRSKTHEMLQNESFEKIQVKPAQISLKKRKSFQSLPKIASKKLIDSGKSDKKDFTPKSVQEKVKIVLGDSESESNNPYEETKSLIDEKNNRVFKGTKDIIEKIKNDKYEDLPDTDNPFEIKEFFEELYGQKNSKKIDLDKVMIQLKEKYPERFEKIEAPVAENKIIGTQDEEENKMSLHPFNEKREYNQQPLNMDIANQASLAQNEINNLPNPYDEEEEEQVQEEERGDDNMIQKDSKFSRAKTYLYNKIPNLNLFSKKESPAQENNFEDDQANFQFEYDVESNIRIGGDQNQSLNPVRRNSLEEAKEEGENTISALANMNPNVIPQETKENSTSWKEKVGSLYSATQKGVSDIFKRKNKQTSEEEDQIQDSTEQNHPSLESNRQTEVRSNSILNNTSSATSRLYQNFSSNRNANSSTTQNNILTNNEKNSSVTQTQNPEGRGRESTQFIAPNSQNRIQNQSGRRTKTSKSNTRNGESNSNEEVEDDDEVTASTSGEEEHQVDTEINEANEDADLKNTNASNIENNQPNSEESFFQTHKLKIILIPLFLVIGGVGVFLYMKGNSE